MATDRNIVTSVVSAGHPCSAHALPRRRIAKLLRDCRIMPKKNRNARPWTAGQGVMRHGRRIKAGFVKHRTTPRHNSYSLLAA